MVLVELTIKGISYSQAQSGAYALILSEVEGNRNLPIIIGGFEAVDFIGLEKEINPPRPTTQRPYGCNVLSDLKSCKAGNYSQTR